MGSIILVALLAASVWIPTLTHRVQASGCYTEFGLLRGGGLAHCSHYEAQVRTYPNGQRDFRLAALGVALLMLMPLLGPRVRRGASRA